MLLYVALLATCISSAISGSPGKCDEHFHDSLVDHFAFHKDATTATYRQRYFVCREHWKGNGSPIFFYTGNEGPVDLYVNNTGLMWENAEAFGALLIFAEVRNCFSFSLPLTSFIDAA